MNSDIWFDFPKWTNFANLKRSNLDFGTNSWLIFLSKSNWHLCRRKIQVWSPNRDSIENLFEFRTRRQRKHQYGDFLFDISSWVNLVHLDESNLNFDVQIYSSDEIFEIGNPRKPLFRYCVQLFQRSWIGLFKGMKCGLCCLNQSQIKNLIEFSHSAAQGTLFRFLDYFSKQLNWSCRKE